VSRFNFAEEKSEDTAVNRCKDVARHGRDSKKQQRGRKRIGEGGEQIRSCRVTAVIRQGAAPASTPREIQGKRRTAFALSF